MINEKRKDALEVLRMDLASRLVPATMLGFVLVCVISLAGRNPALDLALFCAWLLLASAAIGTLLIERHAASEIRTRKGH